MLVRDDLIRIAERLVHSFVHARQDDGNEYAIRMTSGTSHGAPLVTVLKHAVWPENESFYFGHDRIALCFGSYNTRLCHALYALKDPNAQGPRILLVDGNDLTQELGDVLADFAPQTFIGFPSFVARTVEYLPKEQAQNVAHINCTGEAIGKTLKNFFEERVPRAHLRQLYGANEIGTIAVQCPHLLLGMYHPRKGVTIEIGDPDESGVGDILLSIELHSGVSLERYKIGDMGRLTNDVCPCGEKSTLEVVGRRGLDRLLVAGALLTREEFDRAAAACRDLFDDYRGEAFMDEKDGHIRGNVILRVVRTDGGDAHSAQEISKRMSADLFVTPTRTLEDLVAEGLFSPLSIEFVTEPFQREHKDIKLKLRS